MDRHPLASTDARTGFRLCRVWLLVFGGLCTWQAWLTLTLFAPPSDPAAPLSPLSPSFVRHCWQRLCDDQPIVSGAHPLHLYFGYLGAASLTERGTLCCYDPAFQAGFPKTPVFDSGSRPAELFLFLAGGTYRPAAYKAGLAVCCCLVPLFLALAARGFGLGGGPTCVAVALGLFVWWGTPGRAAVEEGELDLLLAALAGLALAGMLAAFDRGPGLCSWFGLFLTGVVGWFAHPFIGLLLLPLVLVYYLSTGTRHGLGWHLALLAGLAGPLAVNAFWLGDWGRYCWIRLPLQLEAMMLPHRTIRTLWSAALWGDGNDRALATGLFVLAVVGVILLNQCRQRPAARLLGLGACGCWALAVVGIAWRPLGQLGTTYLLLPALWFAVPPAAHALARLTAFATGWAGDPWRTAAGAAGVVLAVVVWRHAYLLPWAARYVAAEPLTLGLGPGRTDLVAAVRQYTRPDGRILWEDRPGKREAPRWSVLLPLLTERAFIGGLTPDGCIEHAHPDLAGPTLSGRPLADWSDAELDDYCRRYNIGWVLCWSPRAVARFSNWRGAEMRAAVEDEGTGCLFQLRPRTFILKGQARWLAADCRHITLTDVVPDGGVVVLSLHHQSGLRASPARVQVEREPDPFDPIPFVRLRVPGPTALVTLTWDDR